MAIEEAQRRAGAELYSAHRKTLEAGLDELDRWIARRREGESATEIKNSETAGGERGDAVRERRDSEAELPNPIDWTKM
jgi:hypothetical protein